MKRKVLLFAVLCICLFLVACQLFCEHQYQEEVTISASCTEMGLKTFTCNICQSSYTESIPVTEHQYSSSITKEASCLEKGTVCYTCAECGNSKTEEIAITDHQYEGKITKEASCLEEGEKTYTCSVCGDSQVETLAVTEHDFGETKIIKEQTCTSNGERGYTCLVCNYTVSEELPALGHNWVEVTCAEPKHCTQCDATEGKALGHTTDHGVCSTCNQLISNFNGTKWNLSFGQTMGTNYYAIFKSNGKIIAYGLGGGVSTGKYRINGEYLYITLSGWDNIKFELDEDGFRSTKKYEMMVGENYYTITPFKESMPEALRVANDIDSGKTLSDGKYRAIFRKDTLYFFDRPERTYCTYAEIIKDVTLSDEYVSSLKVGDVIDLSKYGHGKIKVEFLEKQTDSYGTTISITYDEPWLYKGKNDKNWYIVGYSDRRYYYTSQKASLVFADNVKIVDNFSYIYTGQRPQGAILKGPEELFDTIANAKAFIVEIVVKNKKVTSVVLTHLYLN